MHLSDKQRKQAEMETRHTIDHPFQTTIDCRPEEQFFHWRGSLQKHKVQRFFLGSLSVSHQSSRFKHTVVVVWQFSPQVDKSLNKGMVGSDVYLCFKRSLNMAEKISYQVFPDIKDQSQCLTLNFSQPALLDHFPRSNAHNSFTLDTKTVLFQHFDANSHQFWWWSGSPVLPAAWSEHRSVAE